MIPEISFRRFQKMHPRVWSIQDDDLKSLVEAYHLKQFLGLRKN